MNNKDMIILRGESLL